MVERLTRVVSATQSGQGNGQTFRLALNGWIRSDEMTRFIYALKEIRACLSRLILGCHVAPKRKSLARRNKTRMGMLR